MLIKIAAMGPRNYIRSATAFHTFDCFIIIVGIVDVFVSMVFLSGINDSTTATILRGLRILRLFKIARYWRKFEILLETLGMTLANIFPIGCLIFVILFIYTLLGQEFFANKSKFD